MRLLQAVSSMAAAMEHTDGEYSGQVLDRYIKQAIIMSAPLVGTMTSMRHVLAGGGRPVVTREMLPHLTALEVATHSYWHHFDRDWAGLMACYLVDLSTTSTAASSGRPPLFTWLATIQALAALGHVARLVSSASERLLALTFAQQPAESDGIVAAEAAHDLYEAEVEV
eukprot:CAMPEP_0181201568 /NCGR_PEP_ID=MMETSP1096-20121128/18376_1 /TAXON_ID=156174 ORGANISM="Chrysochromulina ericina, Strain CCMP281" /NCGR_SAMPLE_ID=MMETSP1096 /ASSEMBLY_ACC=CAM_ASM_000453 /LENGTH=168 /DNA_ID=CAMNT_0023292019 /DNA_START=120 /DNA_END=626 /DNA_ORIENTATION=+